MLLGMDFLLETMISLVDQEIWQSAVVLGQFLAASGMREPTGHASRNLVLLADALAGKGEHRRALVFYRQATQLLRKSPPEKVETALAGGRGAGASLLSDAKIKLQMARSYMHVKEYRTALAELEMVATKSRSLAINLLLGRLYCLTGYERAAIACYKESLRQCPYLPEAVEALASMHVTSAEILQLLPQVAGKAGRPSSAGGGSLLWVQLMIEGHCSLVGHEHQKAVQAFTSLSHLHPDVPYVLIALAKAQAELGRTDEALATFQRVRALDAHELSGMDEFALLLRERSNGGAELNRLVHDLFQVNSQQPEPWVAAALYWDMRGDTAKAVELLDTGIRMDDRHVLSHLTQGRLYLSLGRTDMAIVALRRAHALRSDFRVLKALVKAYVGVPKLREALAVAKEAAKASPSCHRALSLVGSVYAQDGPEGRAKAVKYYERALELCPTSLEAVTGLTDVHVADGHHSKAINLLLQHLPRSASDVVHTKLASVYALGRHYTQALEHFQAALRMKPLNEDARKGFEQLERLMKVSLVGWSLRDRRMHSVPCAVH
eukprot:jgi/Mesvir1/6988/Mv09127-RA.2